MEIHIEKAKPEQFGEIWTMFKAVVDQKIYYPYDQRTTREEIESAWINSRNLIFVAKVNREIAGAYMVKSNQAGHGDHVANAAYMVNAKHRNLGIGRALAAHSLSTAKEAGFKAMQFNYVVSTNKSAVHLWKSLGFEIIGVIPEGFRHFERGLVDVFIFYKKL